MHCRVFILSRIRLIIPVMLAMMMMIGAAGAIIMSMMKMSIGKDLGYKVW